MAGTDTFTNENMHVTNFNPAAKLLSSKVDLAPRSALTDIDRNKALDPQINQDKKTFVSKIPVYEDKDVSEAFKEVKLDSKEDDKIEKAVAIQHRSPLASVKIDDSLSDISFDVSPSEIDPEFTYSYRIKVHTDELYDCIVYRDDVYDYLKTLELKFKPKASYMKKQPDITYTMRAILVDWLIEVAEEYKLQGETLFLAVSYVDRFLSSMAVVRTKLQLLGTAAMFLASKYEEIYPPEVGEFTYITDDTYTKQQVLRMEHLILKTLNFDVSCPTHFTFITHLAKVCDIDLKVFNLALYICELTLLEGDPYLQFVPSLIVCSAIALAHHCLGRVDVWPKELASASGYSLRHISPVLPHLNQTYSKSPTSAQTASRTKYKTNKYFGTSLIPHKELVVRDPSS